MGSDRRQRLAELPSVDVLLRELPEEVRTWGRSQVLASLRKQLSHLRTSIIDGGMPDTSTTAIKHRAIDDVLKRCQASLVSVFNFTGTVIHTNLGRAPLAAEAIDAVSRVAGEASALEFDLRTGTRGRRESHIESLICELTGAEAATAVNNNAAAVLLVLNTLALGKHVPVSRGELVEIGGSFRIPEVMSRAGCTLLEVGATNRTHLEDFAQEIDGDTALLMKVHSSNFEIQGFTASVPERELAALAHEHGLPYVVDLGSGNLVDFASLGLPDEPTVSQSLDNGADLVTFSGDKLLGGPQAGLIAGRADLIRKIDSNPLKRALRLDKMALAALVETLKLYRFPERLSERLPTLRYLTRERAEVRAQAESLLMEVSLAIGDRFKVTVEDTMSQIGSGSLPLESLPSASLQVSSVANLDSELRRLAARLRELPRPVIGRLHKHALWFDLRCLAKSDEAELLAQLKLLDP